METREGYRKAGCRIVRTNDTMVRDASLAYIRGGDGTRLEITLAGYASGESDIDITLWRNGRRLYHAIETVSSDDDATLWPITSRAVMEYFAGMYDRK